MKFNFNRVLSHIAPTWALKREQAKQEYDFRAWIGQNSGTGYGNGGAAFNQNTMGWNAFSTNADSDLIVNRDTLVQRSRDLFMSSSLANGILKDYATNVTGGGLTLKSNINYEFLGLSRDDARRLEKQIEFEWELWADKSYNCDMEASKSFDDMQTLVMLSVLLSGDVFVAMPLKSRNGSMYDLKLNIIESDRIMDPYNKDPNKNILGGVELDSDGAPVAYYLVNQLPYAQNFAKIQPTTWKRISAFGYATGRRNMLHIFATERPGQRRGIPILSPIIELFKQLTRYSNAEITAATIASMFAVFIKKINPTQSTFDAVGQTAMNRMGNNAVGQSMAEQSLPRDYKLEPGIIAEMNPNESIEVANPTRPNTGYGDFVDKILQQIAVGLGLPPEFMLKNMNSSYSASRAAILLAWKMFKTKRQWLVREFCQPVYEEFLAELVAKGRLNMPGFFDDLTIKAAYCRANWIGENAIQIDPEKDVKAAKIRVEEGFSTREHEAVQQTGMAFEDTMRIQQSEVLEMDKIRRTEKPVYSGVVDANKDVIKETITEQK